MSRIICLALALFGALAAEACGAVNLVTNGSFDGPSTPGSGGTTTPDGWTRRAGESYVVTDPGGNAVDGPNYCQGGQYLEMGQITSHTLVAGETLTFSAYGRAFGTGGGFYDVRLYANPDPGAGDISGGNIIATLQMANDSQVMTLYSTQFQVAAADAGKTLAVYMATQAGYKGFDAISVTTAIPEPSSALALAGGGSLLAMRRSRRHA
jgi:hypothetical protein